MVISWLGHSCFLLETKGIKIITDPYESGSYSGAIKHSPIGIQPDIVTVSHHHADHSYIEEFTSAKIIDKPGVFEPGEIKIQGISSYHDKQKGSVRGKNIIFFIEAEGLKVVHFGDLGTTDINYEDFKNIDIALIPVGGTFTINAKEACDLLTKIDPGIAIPMHFRNSKLEFSIDTVDKFLAGKDYQEKDFLEVSPGNLRSFKKIIALKPQR